MGLPRQEIATLLILAILGTSSSCDSVDSPSKPTPVTDIYILGVAWDGSTTLDGKKIDRKELADVCARLAEQVRSKAKTAGIKLDTKSGLPASIVI